MLLAKDKPNVLLIAIDDLKPLLGAYGDKWAVTPNMDALAKAGVTFLNAHAQQAVCGPSRASVLTGQRPDRTQVWDLKTKMRDIQPGLVTLPQAFKNQGYQTSATGKVFDYRCVDSRRQHDAASWSVPYRGHVSNPESDFGYLDPDFLARVAGVRAELKKSKRDTYGNIRKSLKGLPSFEGSVEVADDGYDDGRIVQTAIGIMDEFSQKQQPFFLAVGFKKPHLPFVAPKKYWDLYDPDTLSKPESSGLPAGAPSLAFQDSWELKNGSYLIEREGKRLRPDFEQKLRHGYYACVSYTDAQVGKLLAHLEAKQLAENTIVVLWSDHGFHLGDHGMWCKHTNYEQSTRVPLLLLDPREKFSVERSQDPVELIDIYPTLLELCGLSPSAALDGKSLLPHLRSGVQHKAFAVSQFPRHFEGREVMGYAYRTRQYRYVEWVDNHFHSAIDPRGEVLFQELYDYKLDPGERKNCFDTIADKRVKSGLVESAKAFRAR